MLDKNKDKKYLAAIAANWITELKRSTTFLWKPRKVRVDDSGWVWGGDWCIVGSDSEWRKIDLDTFFAKMGIKVKRGDNPRLAETLEKAGYQVVDETLAVTVVCVKGNTVL